MRMSDPQIHRHFTTSHGCSTRKRGWGSRKSAHRAAQQTRKIGYGRMRAYLCEECDRWHIGHLPKRVVAGRGWRGG